MTAAEFLDYPWGDTPVELVHGEVRVAPFPAGAHAHVVDTIYNALSDHVRARRLGRVYGDNTGYALPHRDDTIRGPDVSFVRAGRLPAELPLKGLFQIAPDFGVEVLSPTDTYAEVAETLDDFFSAGVQLVWLVDPRRRRVEVVTPDGARRGFGEDREVDAAPVLPEFTMPVTAIFEGVVRGVSPARTSLEDIALGYRAKPSRQAISSCGGGPRNASFPATAASVTGRPVRAAS